MHAPATFPAACRVLRTFLLTEAEEDEKAVEPWDEDDDAAAETPEDDEAPETPKAGKVDSEADLKTAVHKLQDEWKDASDDDQRHDIFNRLYKLVLPWAAFIARRYMVLQPDDAQDMAQEALTTYHTKVFDRRDEIAAGSDAPDIFVGDYTVKAKRGQPAPEKTVTKHANVLGNLHTIIRNKCGNAYKKKRGRDLLVPTDRMADDARGDREDGEPLGHEVSDRHDPSKDVEGEEETQRVLGIFDRFADDLDAEGKPDCADLLRRMKLVGELKPKQMADELGMDYDHYKRVHKDLTAYLKKRVRSTPELSNLLRMVPESAQRLCEKIPLLYLLLRRRFLPPTCPNPLAEIRARFARGRP